MQILYSLQNGQFKSKIKTAKNLKKKTIVNYNNISVVLCKKPLEKTTNIREMRQFWKYAILQRL